MYWLEHSNLYICCNCLSVIIDAGKEKIEQTDAEMAQMAWADFCLLFYYVFTVGNIAESPAGHINFGCSAIDTAGRLQLSKLEQWFGERYVRIGFRFHFDVWRKRHLVDRYLYYKI